MVVKHKGKGVDKNGVLQVDIEVIGEVPILQPASTIVVNSLTGQCSV